MGRKVRAAKASLVAAFLAAGGAAATAKAGSSSHAAKTGPSATRSSPGASLNWGSTLVRFLKLDGYPAYLKIDSFTQYYKDYLKLDELSTFYQKYEDSIDPLLALYVKGGTAHGSLLEGILIGLEQYWKYDGNTEAFDNFFKLDGAQDAYLKFENFYNALHENAKDAFSFFVKETGISGLLPAVQEPPTEIG
jgi:hypothetical protein